MRRALLLAPLALAFAPAAGACARIDPSGQTPFVDGGGGLGDGAAQRVGSLRPFTAPADPGAGAFYVTISGESNAITGYPFPPSSFGSSTYMVDGWEIVVFEYLVVVDRVVLWSNPDRDTSNQGDLTGMQQLAHLDGPFAVDLHKGGPLVGQGGAPEQATPLGVIASQNDNGGAGFDTTDGTAYGFGFSTVPATADAYNVNLDASEAADYALMVEKGYSVFYSGVATWKGDDPGNPSGCVATSTSTGSTADAGVADGGATDAAAQGGYDFTRLPRTMAFKLGFATPTRYVNCQNMSLHAMPLAGEDFPRGVVASPSQSSVAQITLHMDHPFWESFAEDSPLHWDEIAAQFVGQTSPTATTEDLAGVSFHPFHDSQGVPLPWRNCSGASYAPPGNGAMYFSTLSVPIDPTGTCTGAPGADFTQDDCPAIRDDYDYVRFTQSTQGHLNSQGVCFVDRRYPAPAGGS